MSVQPGWYVDPADPETRRYWDGEGWIGAPVPVDATPPDGPPPVEPPPVEPPPAAPQPVTPGAGPVPAPGSVPPATGHAPGPPGAAGPPPGWPPPPPGYGHPGAPPPGWAPPGWAARVPEPRPHGLPLANFGTRLVARLIDLVVLLALNVVVNGWFVWRFIQEYAPYSREVLRRVETGNTSREGLPPIGEQAGGLQLAILLITIGLWLAYEVPAVASTGQTFGKRVMRIKVVALSADQPLGFGRSFRRWNTYGGLPTLLWCCFGIGLLFQLLDALSPLFDHPLRQALHDKRAQTVVVQLPHAAPAPNDRSNPPGDTP
ncbi:RDD family protein [Micromonospora costi]|uniref:RDD family protein n=1 Tax=Micromonospora costi TaxID=1530042 RepID=UPI0034023695